VVYAFFTDKTGPKNSLVSYIAATHSSFLDNPEQDDDIRALHAHKALLNKTTFCVEKLFPSSDVSVDGSTISIPDAKGNVVAWRIVGYDIDVDGAFGGHGICPTELYSEVGLS